MSKLSRLRTVNKLDGYYYLHENGDLIYKRYLDAEQVIDFENSPFVKKYWLMDTNNRANAWFIAIEAAAFGARKSRIADLVEKWKLTDEDAQTFVKVTDLKLTKEGDQWMATFDDFVNLQESQAGFGSTCFDALVELSKEGLLTGETNA
ncbi:hypothetical protein LCGC14_1962840 [marine sediment metagenome]|uniref:Uncharacterized protein n=1 Tax=marine sediment metagenome TaxID=412755 RepID=A0A0F9IB65_9ZZZZ